MAFETYVISWNLTKRCNLRCTHCYLDASFLTGDVVDELSYAECRKLIDQMAEVNPHACLILTGGEPLLREDIYCIASYANDKGFMVVMGTNGLLLNDTTVPKMLDAGIKGIGVSLDSIHPETHDRLRGLSGSWEKAISGIEAAKKYNLDFQIQTTVTKDNYDEIPKMIDFAHKLDATGFYLFFLVCTGRGEKMTDITPKQYEEVLSYVYKVHGNYNGMMVRAKCAPHFKRIA
jgi:MoaA/NifB/PqqE/SkfB family radical SAM enzyme